MATGVGIDLGHETIKAVQVRLAGGDLRPTGAIRLPRRELPPEENDESAPPILGREMARAGLRLRGAVGLTGRDVLLKYLVTSPLPPEKLRLFVSLQMRGGVSTRAATGTAAGPEGLTYDYRLLEVLGGLNADLVVMAGAARNAFLFSLLSSLKRAQVTARRAVPAAFGLAQAWLRLHKRTDDKETVVLVDIGHEVLELAVLKGPAIYFARSAPGHGRKCLEKLAETLGVSTEEAAHLKQSMSLLPRGRKPSGEREKKLQNALREQADGVAGAVRSAVTFCRTQARLPKLDYQRLILSGGGAKLAGLRTYLEKKTGRTVERFDLLSRIELRDTDPLTRECLDKAGDEMVVPFGLALLEADPRAYHLSLMPEAVLRKREFLGKTVFAAAAGAVLLLGLLPPYLFGTAAAERALAATIRFKKAAKQARRDYRSLDGPKEKQRLRTEEVEYFRRRIRPGLTCLALADRLRKKLPSGMTLTYIGSPDNAPALSSATGYGRSLGGGGARTDPQKTFLIRGYRDRNVIPDDRFNTENDRLFAELKKIPGVAAVRLDTGYESAGDATASGRVGFQFKVKFLPPAEPRLQRKPARVKTGATVVPAGASAGTKRGKEDG